MNIFKQFKRNDDRIVNGAKFTIDDKTHIMLARMHESNPAFKAAAQKIMQENQTAIDAIKDLEERQVFVSNLSYKAFAATCVKSWEGLEDENGTLECNAENIKRIQDEVPELWESMCKFSLDPSNYLGQFDEEASVKNL